jgi:predicted helicase
MHCGCGKTYTSFLISENYDIIIISLLKQHTEQNILNFKSIIVDSEGTTKNINYKI